MNREVTKNMHSYSGSISEDNTYIGHSEMSVPYYINCCGYHKIDDVNIALKRNRVDCYLIYLVNGVGHYVIDGETKDVDAGNIIIYRPGQDQDYYYKSIDMPEVYWIHFTGSHALNLLDELGFTSGNIFRVGIHSECIQLFDKIIHELQIKKSFFHPFAVSCLLQLLATFSRSASYLKNCEETRLTGYMENVIKAMNVEFQHDHPIQYYAELSNLSVFQFIRNFKKITGYSPAQYIKKIRIAKAKELLCNSHLTISDIAGIIGYKDPFYFSKVFKKITCIAPSDFRVNSQKYSLEGNMPSISE